MRVEFEVLPVSSMGDTRYAVVDLPSVPCKGDDVEFYGYDYTVKAVYWVINDAGSFALVTLK